MKFSAITALALASSVYAIADPKITPAPARRQATSTASIPPPPAESTGCELHIDHYHCEGPASAAGAASGTSIAPPPAESTGCTLHGDHYHCEGPATGHSDESANDHDHDDHDDHAAASGAVSGSIPPPPAESTGCELHVDHYHCEGPASSGAVSTTSTTSTTPVSATSAPAASATSVSSNIASSASSAVAAAAETSNAAFGLVSFSNAVMTAGIVGAVGVVLGAGQILA